MRRCVGGAVWDLSLLFDENLLSQLRNSLLMNNTQVWRNTEKKTGETKAVKLQNALGYFCFGLVLKIIHEHQDLGWAGCESTGWP